MGQRILGLVLSAFVVGCGSDDATGAAGGPDVPLGETKAIDGAGSPASWMLFDEPFVVRDFAAASGQNLALVGSAYDRDLVFGGVTYPKAGGSDALVGILGAAGKAAWSRGFGGSDADEALAVAVRPSGNVVVGGFFRETINLGGGALTDLRTKPGFSDPYFGTDAGALLVFELDAGGAFLWNRIATSQTGEGTVSAVAIAPNGDVVVAGRASGDLDFGGGTTTGDGIFVARLNSTGAYVSSSRFAGASAHVLGLAVDASGIVLAGSYKGTLDLGKGPLADSGVEEDGFVARLDTAGALVWAHAFGGDNDDRAEGVAVTSDGAVVAAGYFGKTLDLGEPIQRDQQTGFAARISPSGTLDWVRAFGGAGKSRAISVAIAGADRAIVGGTYRDGVDLGGGELPADTDDGFVTGMNLTDGAHLFSRRIARFNFGGLAVRDTELFVAGTCEGVCGIGGEAVPPVDEGRLLVAALSTDPQSHLDTWTKPAELYIEGESHPVRSAIAIPGSAPENPNGMTLILSAAELDCSARSQLPRSIFAGTPRRSDPELAILLASTDLAWSEPTTWLSYGGGGSGGSGLVLVEHATATEIDAYVELNEESGLAATESYVMGKVTFKRCF
jgi:hypothetical protein